MNNHINQVLRLWNRDLLGPLFLFFINIYDFEGLILPSLQNFYSFHKDELFISVWLIVWGNFSWGINLANAQEEVGWAWKSRKSSITIFFLDFFSRVYSTLRHFSFNSISKIKKASYQSATISGPMKKNQLTMTKATHFIMELSLHHKRTTAATCARIAIRDLQTLNRYARSR